MLDFIELDNTTNPDDIVKLLKPWDEEETNRYQPLHHEWERNVLFILGKQWLQEKTGVDGYLILEEDDDHYRPVSNHTARLANLKRSQVMGKSIRPKVQPNSQKKNDIDASRLGYLLLRAKHTIDDEDSVNSMVFFHSQIFGIGWRADFKQPVPSEYIETPILEKIKNEFFQCPSCNTQHYESTCPSCGSMDMEYKSSITEQMKMGPQGIPMMEKTPIYQSTVSVVDPFRIKTSPSAITKNIRWLTDSSIQPITWIKDSFNTNGEGYKPDQLKKIKKSKVLPRGLELSERYKTAITLSHSSVAKDVRTDSSKALENQEERAVLHKSYFPPSNNHKFGRLIVWTEHACIYDGKPDIPNNKKLRRWNPYTSFIYYIHPLRMEGIPYIEDLIPINKKLNSVEAIILDHLDRTADPERYEFGNIMNNTDNSDGKLLIEGDPSLPDGGIPGYLIHPQMASEVYKLRETYVSEMEKVGNLTEIAQGIRPAGVDTYRGLQLLRDAADSSDSEVYERYYTYVRNSAQLKLAIMQECILQNNEELTTLMDIARQNEDFGSEEVKEFLGTDLRDNLNVTMEETDYLSESSGAQSDKIKDALGSGIISPEDLADPVTKLRLTRQLGFTQLPLADKLDIEKAERIIQMLESGEFTKVFPLLRFVDNKNLQLRVWSDWMKTSKFDSLPEQVQMAGEKLVKYVQDQLDQIQQAKAAKSMALAAQAGGGPTGAGPGNPSGPPPGMMPPSPGGPGGKPSLQ